VTQTEAATCPTAPSAAPLLTIVTPTRDDRDRLLATAQSIAAQSGSGYEWVVVDGGSSDDTLAIVARHGRHLGAVVSEPDRGIYDAMNKGLRLARGRFVQFLNAGDRYCGPDALAQILARLRDLPEPVDLLLLGVAERHGRGAQLVRLPDDPARTLPHRLPVCHQGIVFRRLRHLQAPYDTSYQVAADYAAVVTMHLAGSRAATLPAPLVEFAVDRRSFSLRRPRQLVAEYWAVQRDLLRLPVPRRLASAVRRAASLALVHLAGMSPAAGPLALRLLTIGRSRQARQRPAAPAPGGPAS
jgi:putative colanic acid biosynthesis glycosyltransferase